jgi:glycosyltransferase involved in cell wall biosynthesis
MLNDKRIAVVIPCYKVKSQVLSVLARIGPEVDAIYVVDDACPDASGLYVRENSSDPRVRVILCEVNSGVGGAVMTGYRAALADGNDCIVKIDGDGQMDPSLLINFVEPIVELRADYTKGNRFFNLEDVESMPRVRLLGNAVLSFMCKASSGYWSIFDPTNGYTAISARAASLLPTHKISKRYFFETDVLFRLGTFGAVVQDVPMKAVYGDEQSNLVVSRVLFSFMAGHAKNLSKRILYNYFLRGFSVASVELILSAIFILFGVVFGSIKWTNSLLDGVPASSGSVMLAALPVILGVQLLISFLSYDMQSQPRSPLESKKC